VISLLLERETINGSDLAQIVGMPEQHREGADLGPSSRRDDAHPDEDRSGHHTRGAIVLPASMTDRRDLVASIT
jgi:hypothetical protein